MQFEFIDQNKWELINSLQGGASRRTWAAFKGKSTLPYDQRPYGAALDSAYPGFKQNVQGIGNKAAKRVMIDAIKRRSSCLAVAALLGNAPVDELTKGEQNVFNWLIELAKSDPELQRVFFIPF